MAQELILVLRTDEEKAVVKYALERLRRELSKEKANAISDGYKDVCDDLVSRIGQIVQPTTEATTTTDTEDEELVC